MQNVDDVNRSESAPSRLDDEEPVGCFTQSSFMLMLVAIILATTLVVSKTRQSVQRRKHPKGTDNVDSRNGPVVSMGGNSPVASGSGNV